MTNQIDLNSFSAKKYKSELYQLRLNSYLEKSEDFEESDFIESEQKYFNSCYNSVDEDYYNSQRIHWYDLEGEMDYDIYYDLEPQIDGETYQYFSNNRNEQERLIKTFSLILQFLSGTEKSQVKDKPKPPQFEPDEVYKTQSLFKVGLLFAMGEMNKYFTVTSQDKTIMKAGYSAPSIAKELKNNAYNKLILATINNYTNDNTNGNKNVFNSLDMMTKIVEHCNAKNIDIDLYFMKRYLLVKSNA